MAKKSADDPTSWYGTRQVSWVMPCGHCNSPSLIDSEAKNPHQCIHEIPWFDKLWLCGCECNKDWKPVAVIVEKDGTIAPTPEGLVIRERDDRSSKSKKKQEQATETEQDDSDDYQEIEVYTVSAEDELSESGEEKQSSSEETETPE